MDGRTQIDLVLISPNSRGGLYQALGRTLAAIEPPVWAAMMATFIRKKGFSVRIIDGEAEGLSHEQVAERVVDMDPLLATIVVYGHQPSASTQNMTACGEAAAALKASSPELKVLMAGGHVAALPERTLREEQVDFVSCDEGLYTILDLLRALKAVGRPDYRSVRGLWFREGGAFVCNPPAPLLRDLDEEMPELAWDLLPMPLYRAHNWHTFGDLRRQPYAALYTTLGCPYHCTFCCIQAPFKAGEQAGGLAEGINSYRLWSPRAVVAQIDKLVGTYGVRNIKIADEMFVLKPRHVADLCDLLIERGYDLNLWAYARVDTVKDGMLDRLKRAGFNWLAFGIEAAAERVRVDVQKGFEQDEIYRTIERVRAAGISVIGNYIFGLPEDDLESMQATLDLAIELNCEFANFYSTMAYPGSPLYAVARRNGWQLPGRWTGYSQHAVDTLPLPTRHLPASEVLRFRDRAFQTYFTGARYLEMITARFGSETAEHVREMASHRLDRRYAS